jgi:hypothetical protein
MPRFDVTVHKTIYVAFLLDADTKAEAEKLAKEELEAEYKDDLTLWHDYDPVRIEIFAEKLTR